MSRVPHRLSFSTERDAGGRPVPNVKRHGEADAGWTVSEFATPADALAFMACHSAARMPCWDRLADSLRAAS